MPAPDPLLDTGYREQDERDTLLFNLLQINKWFLIPTSVVYQYFLSQNDLTRISVFDFNAPTIVYISVSVLLIVILYMAHNRIAEGTTDQSYHFLAYWLTIFTFAVDVLYVFYLIFNLRWGNLLWVFYLFPLSFPLLVPYIRRHAQFMIDSVFALVLFVFIFLFMSYDDLLSDVIHIPQGDLLIILSSLLYLWFGLRIIRSWIDKVHQSIHSGEERVRLWTDVLRHFPADFFLANERGEVLIASDGASEYLDLPDSPSSRWPVKSEAVRNALLLRFHAAEPVDDPITVPDDERDPPVRVFPSFFIMGRQLFCIALLQEEDPNTGQQLSIMRSDRLAIAGQIAAGLAHEIGNPLGVIRSCAEYLRQKAASDDPNKTEYELIETESIRCQNLIDRLLSLASPKRDTPDIYDLRSILEHAVSMVRYQAGSRVIEQTLPAEEVCVYVNEGQMSAVFVNLLLNALQSMEGIQTALTVRVLLKIRGDYAIVDVTDEGCGISSQELSRIFDPFFTKKASGTGLGLYIVHQIITSAGGGIDVASKLGAGTTFTVRIPLYHGDQDG